MSNNYNSYYTLSPSINQSYVSSQILGPLSTSQTPGLIRYHSYGSLPGVHPNPPKYYPSEFGSEFSQSRIQYAKCDTSVKQQMIAKEKEVKKNNKPYRFFSSSSQRQLPTGPGHMNYFSPIPSSMRTNIVKRTAVGKSSYKQGLPDNALLSYKSYDKSFLRTILQRARSQGCVAPPKVNSIFNSTCRAGGSICNRGAIVGQGY
jgi:hypothetical protein